MAAYGAVISLKLTIHRLLNSSHLSIISSSREIIEFAYKELESLQEVLKKFDESSSNKCSKRVNALNRQIGEAVCDLENAIEFHVSDQSIGDHSLLSLDLHKVKPDVDSFTQKMKKMKEEYIEELSNLLLPEEDDHDHDFGGKKSKMVGLSDELSKARDLLTRSYYGREPVSLVVISP